jgi:UDP-glucose 4-epimerase
MKNMGTKLRYFITGGAGFIGSHFVDRLLGDGNEITVYDNLNTGKLEWITQHFDNPNFLFVKGDLLDVDHLNKAISGHDFVIHLGANTDILLGNENPRVDLDNCTIATANLLEVMRMNQVTKLLFSSSATVYGDLTFEVTSESTGPLLPISLYGAGKLACEGMISAYCHLFGFQAWIYRFGNVVGARMSRGVIHDFILKLQKNPEELEILGDGRGRKNYFLVEECVEGMLFGAEHFNSKACDAFNLGSETTVTVTKIAEIVMEEMGLAKAGFRYTGGERGWPGDVPVVLFDASKMRDLGWEAKHTSAEAVRITARRLLDGNLGPS